MTYNVNNDNNDSNDKIYTPYTNILIHYNDKELMLAATIDQPLKLFDMYDTYRIIDPYGRLVVIQKSAVSFMIYGTEQKADIYIR